MNRSRGRFVRRRGVSTSDVSCVPSSSVTPTKICALELTVPESVEGSVAVSMSVTYTGRWLMTTAVSAEMPQSEDVTSPLLAPGSATVTSRAPFATDKDAFTAMIASPDTSTLPTEPDTCSVETATAC